MALTSLQTVTLRCLFPTHVHGGREEEESEGEEAEPEHVQDEPAREVGWDHHQRTQGARQADGPQRGLVVHQGGGSHRDVG